MSAGSIVLDEVAQPFFGVDEILKSQLQETFPQPGHVDGEGVVVDEAVAFPEALHDGVPGDSFPFVFQQKLEDFEFVFR